MHTFSVYTKIPGVGLRHPRRQKSQRRPTSAEPFVLLTHLLFPDSTAQIRFLAVVTRIDRIGSISSSSVFLFPLTRSATNDFLARVLNGTRAISLSSVHVSFLEKIVCH